MKNESTDDLNAQHEEAALMFLNQIRGFEHQNESTVDRRRGKDNNPHMEDAVSRPELDAKLETIEVKMEGRLTRIDDKLETLDRHLSGQKAAIWGAAAVTIGAVLSAMGLVVASFDSGRETAGLISEVKATQSETRRIIEIVGDRVEQYRKIAPQIFAPGTLPPSNK